MNIHRFGFFQYALLVATAMLVVLFFQVRRLDMERHGQCLEVLLRLEQAEARLDRDVFRISSFQLVQYDPLVEETQRIRTLSQRLRASGDQLSDTLNEPVDGYLGALRQKLDLVERLKATAALMRNLFHYLPQAAETLSQRAPALGNRLIPVLDRLYRYNLLPSDLDRQSLIDQLNGLDATPDLDDDTRKALDHVLLHMRSNLRLMGELNALRNQYVALPSGTAFDRLYTAYSDFRRGRTRLAHYLSYFLILASLSLLVGLGVALRKIHRAQQALEQAHDRLHSALENLSEGFALFGPDERLVLYNQNYRACYPWLGAILSNRPRFSELAERIQAKNLILRDLANTRLPKRPPVPESEGVQMYQEQQPDGRWFLASDTRTPQGDLICVRVEITESKRSELQLRKLYRALEQSPATVIITDEEGRIEYVNPKFEETTGYTAAEALGQNPRILKSGDKSSEEYKKLWDTIKAGRVWRGQFHNRRKDGGIYWEAASISPVRDEQGRITHFIAVKEDITARKRAEEQLRLNATVFETTTEGIMVTDRDNRIVTVNPAFTRITGYEADEVIGRNPKILSSGRHGPEFYARMWARLKQKGFWGGEIWNRRKNGEIYPEWLSIAAIHDRDHPEQEYVAIFSDISQRKRDEAQIQRQANFDPLTGLPNRFMLSNCISHSLASARREHWLVALLFLDLDHFKQINDTLGHVVGDTLLQQVAQRLRACVRESDTVARFGGDEFVILLEDIHGARAAATVAKKIIAALRTPFDLNGHEGYIGTSIGITLFPSDAQDAHTLLRNADMAMYRAKESGRNNYQFFTKALNERMQARIRLERDLRLAWERQEFSLQYQPIIDFTRGRMTGVEALLRWHHPERGPVPPGQFVPLAEEIGLIDALGLWVLEGACAQAMRWRNAGLDLQIHVNLSSRQIALGLSPEKILNRLAQYRVPTTALTLEITEHLVLDENAASLSWIRTLRDRGVRFAVDDFGTGYSSLSYLKRFPIDALKIDQSFVRSLPENPSDASLVKAIIAMAYSLSLGSVAEGIETQAQFAFLQTIGCRKGQGYLFSPPVPAERIPALARRTFLRQGEQRYGI